MKQLQPTPNPTTVAPLPPSTRIPTPIPGRSLKETFEQVPAGTCASLAHYEPGFGFDTFQSVWAWEIRRLTQWGTGKAICEIRVNGNNKYLHVEIYTAGDSGAGYIEVGGWFSTPLNQFATSLAVSPSLRLELDVVWQPSVLTHLDYYPARIRPGNWWFKNCAFGFSGTDPESGHFTGDVSGCGTLIDGIIVEVAFDPLSPPPAGKLILDLDNIEIKPSGSGSMLMLNLRDSSDRPALGSQGSIQLHRR